MTAETAVDDARMIEIRGHPRDGRVTVVAIVPARNMRQVLAGRGATIMTGSTGTDHLGVIDQIGRRPDVGVVAGAARCGGVDVIDGLARGLRAVVTAGTERGHVGVIEHGRHPAGRRMTFLAVVAARDVGRVLAGSRGSVMA